MGLSKNADDYTRDMYRNRSALAERVRKSKKKEIISKFDYKLLVEMMFSEEGNYIVQCIILNLPISEIQFIIPLV